MVLIRELYGEFRSVVSGKTVDALLPPLIYAFLNSTYGLERAILASLGLALALGLMRIARGQTWYYALGGLIAVGLASALAYLNQNAASYFLPGMVGNGLLFVLTVVSLAVGKPLIAWLSHVTRGWPLEWFWREDVQPAYGEVTRVWAGMFFVRLVVQMVLYAQGDVMGLAWTNVLLGWPVTIAVLVFTYVYGIRRLRRLGGPGVDEFRAGKEPPWRGQIKGF